MKAIVFGATTSARNLYEEIRKKYDIIAFCDNDEKKWGGGIDGTKIIAPADILKNQWDEIIIISLSAMEIIKKQLIDMGISESRINTSYIGAKVTARKRFVQDFAAIIYNRSGISGSVAEAGVFQGEFARIINESFPDRKLYLFDTFEGFDERDVLYEEKNGFSDAVAGHLHLTSESLVLEKMNYPEMCVIKKGYFPESAKGITDKFCYVNLDMDLYKPTLEGLRFFWPLMVSGGIITVHDYFSVGYDGVNMALQEFIEETGNTIVPFPIGDHVSIAIQKR